MTVEAFVLLGGVGEGFFGLPEGWDGPITSAGMDELINQLKAIPGVNVWAFDWGDYAKALADIGHEPGLKTAVIGYSGGGSRATWLANSPVNKTWPHIDLMVCYDPSPRWQMMPLHGNVTKAINYHNLNPMMPSLVGMLGGGEVTAAETWGCKTILTRHISEQHLEVQFDQSLHAATVQAVRDLMK